MNDTTDNKPQNTKYVFLICVALALAILAVFWQVRRHEFINFDDNQYIVKNSQVNAGLTRQGLVWAFTSICAHNWHPLTWISHMLDCELYGLNPGGHHFTNVLFHIANALLLFWVLWRMTSRLWLSAFVAAAFALHPLHVESVAWASERKDVLSTFFLLLTMWTYVRYVEHPTAKRYLLILLFFVLGLLAKQMLVTLPFVLLLLDYWPLRRLTFKKQNFSSSAGSDTCVSIGRCVLEKLPLFILSVVASGTVFLVQRLTVMKSVTEYPLLYRIENALVSYIVYICKMFWPSRLAIFYPHPLGSLPTWKIANSVLLLVCITIVAIWKARQYPYLVVGWLWYLITLVPVIGLVQVGLQAHADRYTYMSLTGLFIIVAWGVRDLFARFRYRKVILCSSLVILFLLLGVTTWCQVGRWRSSITLYKHTTAVVKNNWWAYFRLGMAFDQQDNLDEAIKHYTRAIQIKPEFPAPHRNLGYALARQGKTNEAIRHYNDALRYRPDFAEAHVNLGNALLRLGKIDEAIEHFSEAVQIEPDSADAHYSLGYALTQQGKFDKAIECYSRAAKLEPNWSEARQNLNKLLLQKKRLDETIAQYIEAVEKYPDNADAHDRLAGIFYNAGRIYEAIEHWNRTIALRPEWAEVYNNLAWILAANEEAGIRNPEEAVRFAKKACELTDYRQPEMLDTLGVAFAAAGRFPQAIETAEKAIELAGDEKIAEDILSHLELYKMNKPYRD
jgi:tetratricopeptide (TPR) repeat protein